VRALGRQKMQSVPNALGFATPAALAHGPEKRATLKINTKIIKEPITRKYRVRLIKTSRWPRTTFLS